MNIILRKAEEKDSGKIWTLMKELAVFEKYIDSFAITPEIVKESGFSEESTRLLLYRCRRQRQDCWNAGLLFFAVHRPEPTGNLYERTVCG